MPKLNEVEVHQVLNIENKKRELLDILDTTIHALMVVRTNEHQWWHSIVDKYHLNPKIQHRIWIDGEIVEERRREKHGRKIF